LLFQGHFLYFLCQCRSLAALHIKPVIVILCSNWANQRRQDPNQSGYIKKDGSSCHDPPSKAEKGCPSYDPGVVKQSQGADQDAKDKRQEYGLLFVFIPHSSCSNAPLLRYHELTMSGFSCFWAYGLDRSSPRRLHHLCNVHQSSPCVAANTAR